MIDITPLIYVESVATNVEQREPRNSLDTSDQCVGFAWQVVDMDMVLIASSEQIRHWFRS
jgi:hypothetical protein